MSDYIIKVESIGKKYRIRHQQERYVALRDVLTSRVRDIGSSLLAMGRHIICNNGRTNTEKLSADTQNPTAEPLTSDFGPPTSEEFWALKDVSFEVKQGEVVGIIGRNGAGKSTLLKILSRITEPTTGRVHIRGRVASLLEVGTGFHSELTGRENIFLNGAILGMTKAEIKRKFDEIVAFAEIEKFLDTPVKRYSSGMYVRLAFAVAAHLDPEILVVDEVLAVGDAWFQKKCLGKMQDVNKGGRTVLFVSHNMPTVQTMCRRVLVLHKGAICVDSDPMSAISEYLHRGADIRDLKSDLRIHDGRRNCTARSLLSAWLEDGSHQPINTVPMGEQVYFCFEFRCETPVKSPVFGFGIEDSFGKRVFSLNNLMKPNPLCPLRSARQGVARLFIPRNPLLPGSYFLSVSLVEGPGTWVDFVEQAIEFKVVARDVYGFGKIPDPAHGFIYIDGDILVDAI